MALSTWSTGYSAALSAALFLFSIDAASAVDPKDVSYLCVAGASGGLTLNAEKRWIGTGLPATDRFVLRLSYVGVRAGKSGSVLMNFEATVTGVGSNSGNPCTKAGVEKNTVPIDKYGSFDCTAALQQYHFNLGDNRYISVNPIGYLDGDRKGDAPSITAGICNKVN